MVGEPAVRVYGHGLPEETTPGGPPHEGPATAVVTHGGLKFFLRFERGDLTGSGELQGLLIQPDTEKLTPQVLRRLAPQAELYLAYARAAMRWGGSPLDVEDPTADIARRNEEVWGAADALRAIAGPGRGLSDEFYRIIARHYDALVSEGERNPIKTIGEVHHVTISAASRWVKESRRRGYIPAPSD